MMRILRRIAAIFILILVTAACLAVDTAIALSPGQLEKRLRSMATSKLYAAFDFDSVNFSLREGLRVEGVRIGNPEQPALAAESLNLCFDLRRQVLTKVEISELSVFLRVNPDMSTNLDNLFKEGTEVEWRLPEVEVTSGQILLEAELAPGDITRTVLDDLNASIKKKTGLELMGLSVFTQNPHLGRISVKGILEPDFRNGDMQLTARNVDLASIASLLPGKGKELFNALAPRGKLDLEARLSLVDGTPSLNSALEVSSGAITYAEFPIPLQDICGTAEITLERLKLTNFTAQAPGNPVTIEGCVEFSSTSPRAQINIFAKDIEASDELLSFVPEAQRQIIEEYAPIGCADISVQILKTEDSPNVQVEVEIEAHGDVSIAQRNFPYRLENITGTLVVTPGRVELRNIESVMDGQTVAGNGYANMLPRNKLEIDVAITGRNVRLDERLRQALEEEDRQTWDTLNPAGKCNLLVKITSSADNKDHYINVDVSFGGFASITPELFQLEVSGLTGTLSITPDNATHLKRIRGHAAGGGVVVADTVIWPKEKCEATIRATFENVGVGRDVFSALSSRLQTDLEDLSAGGHLSGEIHLKRPKGENEFLTRGKVRLKDGWAIHKLFPVKAENLEGMLLIEPDGYYIHSLTGNVAKGRLEAWGELLELPDEKYNIRLRLESFDVLADHELKIALPEDMVPVWEDYNPYGRMDVAIWLDGIGPPLQDLKKTLKLHLRNISGKYVDFPCPFSGAAGDVRMDIDTGKVEIKDVYTPGRKASISGAVIERENGYVADLGIKLKKQPLDNQLHDAMPEMIQWMWKEIKLGGAASGVVKLHIDKVGDRDADVDYDVVLRPDEAYFEAGFPFTKVRGKVTLRGNVSPEDVHTLKYGFIQLSNFELSGLPVTWASAPIQMTDDSLTLDPITGKMANGTLSGTLEMEFGKNTIYSGRIELANASVKQAVSQLFNKKMEKTTGHASAWVEFAGKGWDKSTLLGKGELRLTQSNLWEVPFFSTLAKALSFGAVPSVDFSESFAKFHIKGEKLDFTNIYFHSSVMNLDGGTGTLTLDGEIDFLFKVSIISSILNWDPTGILPGIVKTVEGNLFAVRTTGTTKKVIVKPGPLTWLKVEKALTGGPETPRKDKTPKEKNK